MTGEKIKLEYISWKQLHIALINLAKTMISEGYRPDIIYAVIKGGLIPARILSDLLEVDQIGFIGVKFYKGIGTREAKPELTLPPTHPVRNKNVLVVDDVVDSGRTLQLVLEELNRYGARNIKSLVIYVKPWSPIYPDYYYKETRNWVVFPWEIIETSRETSINPEDLGEDKTIFQSILRSLIGKS
ncbi:phosphoribosyltransferase [Staphylothermus marinus F1]|uniref:Phosphoribosyltransferase n=1 Tax=Staphylothermus marinus (strain ATCC 43588 / DSM 3639 / JCM 9404 / F1) TaxID=399550 RepID=A3DM52_STAMF|nr:phosphoribosyltransferase family protein [Staphylothermus marinus]ABN69712.1 phosphoribosyltransferase [Staphylothermus marinus F1]